MTKSNWQVAADWVDWCEHPDRVHRRAQGTNKNVSWEGTVFWSRQTPIAVHYHNKLGATFILMSSERYSPSTGGQLSRLSMAITHKNVTAFSVPHIGYSAGWSREPRDTTLHKALIVDTLNWRQDIYDFADRQVKNWRVDWGDWQNRLRSMKAGLDRWHRITGAEELEPINIEQVITTTDERIQRKRADFYAPAAVEKRERAAAKRVALKALNLK